MAEVPVFNYQFGSTLGAGPMGFPSGAFNTGGAYTSESSGDEDYWRYSPPVDGVNLFNFPSYESFRAGQSGGETPTVGSTFSGGAGSTGFGGIDAAGPVRMDPFTVSTTPFTGSTVFDYAFPGTSGLAGQGGGAAGAGGAVQGPTVMEPFVVPGTRVPQVGNLNVLGYDPNAPIPGPTAPVTPIGTGSQPPVQLPTVTVEATKPSGERPNWFEENLKNVYNTTTVLPPFTVTPGPDKKPDENIPVVNTTTNRFNVPAPIAGPLTVVGPSQGQTQQVGPTVATGEGPAPSTGTTGSTGGGTSGTGPQRDFAKELGATLAGLQQYQPQLLSMYKDLYQSFMPQGLTAAETSGLAQMRADEEKLNRLRQGILSPEDIRTATQGAREAYGARGQVFAPGAIGAEILNREAIRQQREDQARAAYQQSIGNLLNVSNLQTGNIFQPISSLLSGTFNPLGAYPADVYGTNVNAALARDIAERNKEAAIESARMAGAAGTSAAKTSAAGSIGAAALPFLAKGAGAVFGFPVPSCMPGNQCIDTPNGPKPIKDLKGGDIVIGYNGEEAFIMQACSWNQDPTRTFLTITREDGTSFTVCDDHKILGIPAMEWVEGANMAGSRIKSITTSNGLLTSYDILTNQGGYRIAGVPVNSMIPEIMRFAARVEAISAIQNPA